MKRKFCVYYWFGVFSEGCFNVLVLVKIYKYKRIFTVTSLINRTQPAKRRSLRCSCTVTYILNRRSTDYPYYIPFFNCQIELCCIKFFQTAVKKVLKWNNYLSLCYWRYWHTTIDAAKAKGMPLFSCWCV